MSNIFRFLRRSRWRLLGSLVCLLIILHASVSWGDLNFGSVHLLMGNPSSATRAGDQPDNYLMIKRQYALSYNHSKGIPNWVSWELNKSWLGNTPRQDDFRADLTLPKKWYRVTPKDYTGSGFDRGHLISSEDRGASPDDNSATFLMPNIIPQSPDNNRGPWVQLEAYCRELVTKQGHELYIIAGPAGVGGMGEQGAKETLAEGKVTVPASTWKIVLVLDQPGSRLSGITENSRVIAVLMPNQQGIKQNSWKSFRKSVDEIEALTGYNFLSNVSAAIQDVIEARVDDEQTR
ncbi:DNA/RNA non-specific endonuclease [Kovacikia minuta CCNUW1]|uniref:DNA/RNA non-specific endonuclease n=1 Tax=Kovacikia minuta TaxID=2931930 RepID=UPI001CCA978E|nr:DNA/RNA non-specific endonuclease [Kovacikia minuta]UBF27474.1 DNA/RNA non-specific endonuclease [Kovacikia minuta CCNUW1]